MFSASHNRHVSLDQASTELASCTGISVTKQSLDGRFNEDAVSFMRSLLEELLSKQIRESFDPGFLKRFNQIRIKDSTRFNLHDRLKEPFRGFGGKGSTDSALAIQYEFDLKTGSILDLDITDAVATDYIDANKKSGDIKRGDLVIRDLGYLSLDTLKKIIKKKAYLISRLQAKVLVYETNGKEISFPKLYKYMLNNNITHLQKLVLISKKEKIPVRLIIDIVPEETYQKRIRKINVYNRRKGNRSSGGYKWRARFNLFFTNVPEKLISHGDVYKLYKLRWQAELIFKTMKSTMGIDKNRPMKYHRFMCMIYAKLILYMINNQIVNVFQARFYHEHKKFLSRDKCFSTLMRYFFKLRRLFTEAGYKTAFFLSELFKIFSKNHWLEKRKNRVNYIEIIEIFI
jgi:hypothetical protein